METARGGLPEVAAKACGMYTAEEKRGDKGEEQAVEIPEWSCLVCSADGFWGSGKNGLLQCKNQRNFCLELG